MGTSGWRAYDHYAYAAVAMLGTLAAVVATYWLLAGSPWSEWARSLAGVSSPFTNVVGVLFGLTLAFLANDTWTAHDRATNAVLREADAIRGLLIVSRTLDGPERNALHAAIADYARASVAEWPLLARRSISPAAIDGGDRLLSLAASRAVGASVGGTVQQLMLRQVTAIRESRDLRIGLSQTHVDPLKWLSMAFLGFLTLLSVAVVHVGDPKAALVAMVLFGSAAAPTAAIVLIHGNPFQRPSVVASAPILAALSRASVADGEEAA
ncbi:hypothetical protein [Phenylobacterium sp.]|uniref:bestrophin-like domain n=1 Tax=Phenylobacterium sp. TaxID=1871053 RepID=UPI0035AE7720